MSRRSWLGPGFRRLARSRRALIWGAILEALAISLCFVPLFDTLGFEFSFSVAFLAAFAAADLGATAVRYSRELPPAAITRPPGARLLGGLAAQGAAVTTLLLLLPLLTISLNAVRISACDWGFGLLCYFAMPILSAWLCAILGVVSAVWAGPRRFLGPAAPYLALGAVILAALWRFYAAPPVYSYNLLTGFFPGNLYDERVALRAPFLWLRIYELAWLTALLCATATWTDLSRLALSFRNVAWVPWRKRSAALAAVAAFLTVLIGLFGGDLGFRVNENQIARDLGARYETENFILYYPARSDIERRIDSIAEDHEFRLWQVERDLGVEVPGKITSFYFEDGDAKYRAMGARYVYMAKPWRQEIYLNDQEFPHQVLRHELVHVVAGEFGDALFHVSVKPWLGLPVLVNVGMIEGIAVAIDWPDHFTRALTPHQSVKALYELDYAPPLSALFSPGFFAFSSSRSYTVAGSFLRWLYETRGVEKLRELYRSGGDFDQTYGQPVGELMAEWRRFIDATELPPGAAEIVRERFRRRSIFKRYCPHAVASWRDELVEFVRAGDRQGALRLARHICEAVPHEPRYQLDLATVLRGVGNDDDALEVYRGIAGDEERVSSSLRATALLGMAAVAASLGNWEETVHILDRAASLPVPDQIRRNIVAQRFAALNRWPGGAALRAYFWNPKPGAGNDGLARAAIAVARDPDSALAHYLLGRNLIEDGPAELATTALDRALELGLPHPLLTRECARLLASQAYLAGNDDALKRAVAVLTADDQPEVLRLLGADWLERLEWRNAR